MSFQQESSARPSHTESVRVFRGLLADNRPRQPTYGAKSRGFLGSKSTAILSKVGSPQDGQSFTRASCDREKTLPSLSPERSKTRIQFLKDVPPISLQAGALPPLIKNHVTLQRIIQRTVHREVACTLNTVNKEPDAGS